MAQVLGGGKPAKVHGSRDAEEWRHAATLLLQQFRGKQGVELGGVSLLLHVQPCEGLLRRVDGSIEKRFGHAQISYPLQARSPHTIGSALKLLKHAKIQVENVGNSHLKRQVGLARHNHPEDAPLEVDKNSPVWQGGSVQQTCRVHLGRWISSSMDWGFEV